MLHSIGSWRERERERERGGGGGRRKMERDMRESVRKVDSGSVSTKCVCCDILLCNEVIITPSRSLLL